MLLNTANLEVFPCVLFNIIPENIVFSQRKRPFICNEWFKTFLTTYNEGGDF